MDTKVVLSVAVPAAVEDPHVDAVNVEIRCVWIVFLETGGGYGQSKPVLLTEGRVGLKVKPG
jgi:hypothetical protein